MKIGDMRSGLNKYIMEKEKVKFYFILLSSLLLEVIKVGLSLPPIIKILIIIYRPIYNK